MVCSFSILLLAVIALCHSFDIMIRNFLASRKSLKIVIGIYSFPSILT